VTLTRVFATIAFGALTLGAVAQSSWTEKQKLPKQKELQTTYIGHSWQVNYTMVPCKGQIAEITALELFKEKVHQEKAVKGQTVELQPPGERVRFTLRCPDGTSYTREIGARYFQAQFVAVTQ
jgi:hypothetical protein